MYAHTHGCVHTRVCMHECANKCKHTCMHELSLTLCESLHLCAAHACEQRDVRACAHVVYCVRMCELSSLSMFHARA